MKRELVEITVASIDNKYIEEAINYKKKSNIVSFRNTSIQLAKVAAVTLALFAVGTATAYATYSYLKEVRSEDNYIYVGEAPTPEMVNDEYVEAQVAESKSRMIVEDKGTIIGDESVNWLTKNEKNIYNRSERISDIYDNEIKYTYDSYEKAVIDAELDKWFPEIMGDVVKVEYVYVEPRSQSRDKNLSKLNIDYAELTPVGTIDKRVCAEYAYGNGTFLLEESRHIGAPDVSVIMEFDEKENEREYVNKAGQVFTLIDGTDYIVNTETEESIKLDNLSTYVLICYDDYSGIITFRDMTENEIHEILDSIQLSK